jgi:hypothetical protein
MKDWTSSKVEVWKYYQLKEWCGARLQNLLLD